MGLFSKDDPKPMFPPESPERIAKLERIQRILKGIPVDGDWETAISAEKRAWVRKGPEYWEIRTQPLPPEGEGWLCGWDASGGIVGNARNFNESKSVRRYKDCKKWVSEMFLGGIKPDEINLQYLIELSDEIESIAKLHGESNEA